jgi:hypothetical protein
MKRLLFLSTLLLFSSSFAKGTTKVKAQVENKIITTQEYRSDVVKKILNHQKEIKECKKKTKPGKGRVVIAWDIDPSGVPRDFTKGEDTLGNEKTYHCLIKKIEKWRFSPTPDERTMGFEYLFVF